MSQTITPSQLQQWLFDGQEIAVFDVREHGQYGEAHLFHGVNLPYSRLELEVRRLAPNPQVRLVIYDQDGGEVAARAAARLQALGYSRVQVLEGGAQGWQAAGLQLFAGVHVPSKAFGELVEEASHTPHVTGVQTCALPISGEPLVVLDGRPFDEYRKMTIPGSICCPNGELGYRVHDLVPDQGTPIVVNCAGRTRSIIGAQTLINLGLKNPIYALENGTQGWYLEDFQLEHGSTRRYTEQVSGDLTRQRLAARQLAVRAGVVDVSADQVRGWADDAQRSLFLCDVRTAQEFAVGSLPGSQHTPGGQLIQSTDLYIGVRQARIVLVDSDGVRAPIVASWLRQLGHEAYVLSGGIHSGLALPVVAPVPSTLPLITTQALAEALKDDSVALIDLRPSMTYRKGHIAGSRWSIRSLLASAVAHEQRPLVLLADDPAVAQIAALELPESQYVQTRLLDGGFSAWQSAGLPVSEDANTPPKAECIDFLFFTHDRHSGNKDAARQYLAWEIGLLGQMTDSEIASLKPLHSQVKKPLRSPSNAQVRTRLVHAARTEKGNGGRAVNVSVTRLSTVLFDSLGEMRDARARRDTERVLSYGARGNPTAFALEDLVTELEGGHRTRLFQTGLAAVAQTFLAYLRPGDHVLITDAVYSPVRRLAREFLQPFGIQVSYLAPDGRDLHTQLQANTKMVYT